MKHSFATVRKDRLSAIRVDLVSADGKPLTWAELALLLKTSSEERRSLVQVLREIPLTDYRLEAHVLADQEAVLFATPGFRAGGLGPFMRDARVSVSTRWVEKMADQLNAEWDDERWIISDSLSFRLERSAKGVLWVGLQPAIPDVLRR